MNRLYDTSHAARAAPCGVLDVVNCDTCGFAWNRAFEPELVTYGVDYNNDQGQSPAFQAHIRARAEDILASVPESEPIDYLEIGCGQGQFIEETARATTGRLRSAVGFDPAWRGCGGAGPHGSRIYKELFSDEQLSRVRYAPNVVVSRHTIEHIVDPLMFLQTIRRSMSGRPGARIFIETPCIEWIINNNATYDLFYEHCSLFSADSLRFAMTKAGFGEVKVEHVFGGQYLWATGAAEDTSMCSAPPIAPSRTRHGSAKLSSAMRWREIVAEARRLGPVAVWGAGAKGITFTLLSDPTSEIIDCAVDINPQKQGLYMPGSGVAVLSPGAAALRGINTVFVVNRNYLDEIKITAAEVGMQANFICIEENN